MTTPTSYSEPFGNRLPSDSERHSANQLRKLMAAKVAANQPLQFQARIDENSDFLTIELPSALARLLISVLRVIGSGKAVTLVPVGEKLTTQQAADILNVSRPYLIKLLDKQEIEHELVGRHRRILAKDIFNYKERMLSSRAKLLDEIAADDKDHIWN